MSLLFVLAESALEMIPKEISKHPSYCKSQRRGA
jgi:rRNA pseudouridine-1189 N-methylase Emg1 (Nep1/Mra1 family)